MPAQRRSSRLNELRDSTHVAFPKAEDSDIAFAPTITPTSYESTSSAMECPYPESDMFTFEKDEPAPQRSTHSRKKPVNHIPRPPNAFILFRSAFIKSQHVSTGVETNHSTLSKIIGLTWQRLSNEERQKWHAKAKVAQEDHKRRYPQYAFRPIHNKSKATSGPQKKLREVGPKDHQRCAKIADLLVCGKKGQELEDAIQEYDKHHVPEIVTRFEEPITAHAFSSPSPSSRSSSPGSIRRSSTPYSTVQSRANTSSPMHRMSPPRPVREISEVTQVSSGTNFDTNLFFPNTSPSFEFDTFTFSIEQPQSYPSESLSQVVSPSFSHLANQDQSHLCGNPQQYTDMDGWARSCSPLSTSTNSMPSTPAHMNVPFPEQTYGTFAPESGSGSGYAPLDTSYNDFSRYASYAPPSCEADYGAGDIRNHHSVFPPNHNLEVAQAPINSEALDFSMFMASLPSYSL